MTSSPAERRDHAQLAANTRWAGARHDDRKAAMEPAARGMQLRFIRQVDPDGVLSPEELAAQVENARAAHMARMRLAKAKRARSRRDAA